MSAGKWKVNKRVTMLVNLVARLIRDLYHEPSENNNFKKNSYLGKSFR